MKKVALLIVISLFIASCGENFFLDRQPFDQIVSIASNRGSLSVPAETVVDNNVFRSKMTSDFYRGYADVSYENGAFKIICRNLPVSEEQLEQFKQDIYAIYFAGGYPYTLDLKMFGKTEITGNEKFVYDTDGYQLYKIRYNQNQIYLYNNIKEYSIVIDSKKDFSIKQ